MSKNKRYTRNGLSGTMPISCGVYSRETKDSDHNIPYCTGEAARKYFGSIVASKKARVFSFDNWEVYVDHTGKTSEGFLFNTDSINTAMSNIANTIVNDFANKGVQYKIGNTVSFSVAGFNNYRGKYFTLNTRLKITGKRTGMIIGGF